MEYREIRCAFCGAKILDRSTNHNRRFCGQQCAQAHHRRSHGVGVRFKTPSCTHNKEVRCFVKTCGTCGWNPKVEQKRKEAMGYG